jgi:hypothetical protein
MIVNMILNCIAIPFVSGIFACASIFAQELPSLFPGVTTLSERIIPAHVGLSQEMIEVVNERQIPPAILISGTRDLLLSDTVRMHRALRKGGVADLHVYDGQAHGGYI